MSNKEESNKKKDAQESAPEISEEEAKQLEIKSTQERLSRLFYPEEIEWIPGRLKERNGVKDLDMYPYVSSRSVMDRLDEVLGIGNWQTCDLNMHSTEEKKYNRNKQQEELVPLNGWTIGLMIRIDGEWITRYDGADLTDFESFKGGISGALKRAAVSFGIGRYLYRLKDMKAIIHSDGEMYQKDGSGTWFNYTTPRLPNWAIPGEDEYATVDQQQELVEFYKGGTDKYKAFLVENIDKIDRRTAYVAIKKQYLAGTRKDETTKLKEVLNYFKTLNSDEKTEPKKEKKNLKKPKEQIEREENQTEADDLPDSPENIDVMKDLGL